MKTLYFLRHAKSSWKHTVGDRQRPLKKQGVKDASQVSKLVAQTIVKPQVIITSDALRTQSTATYFKDAFELWLLADDWSSCSWSYSDMTSS